LQRDEAEDEVELTAEEQKLFEDFWLVSILNCLKLFHFLLNQT